MSRKRRAVLLGAMLLVLLRVVEPGRAAPPVEPPNPACVVPVPFHCDPKPGPK